MAPEPSAPKKPKPFDNYLRFTGLGFQFLGVIAIFTWFGWKIDRWLHLTYPVALISGVFLSFLGMMVYLYRSLK